MSVTPRGIYCGPVDALRTMLGNCASVQKLFQAASAAAALASGKIIPFGEACDAARPYALINFSEAQRESISARSFTAAGTLSLAIEVPLLWQGEVTAETSPGVFTVAALAGLKDDFFTGQRLTVNTGAQAGQVAEVSDFTTAGELTLLAPLPGLPGVGSVCSLAPASVADAMYAFMNIIGDIQEELEALSGSGDALQFRTLSLRDYGRPEIEDDEDAFAGAMLEVAYG